MASPQGRIIPVSKSMYPIIQYLITNISFSDETIGLILWSSTELMITILTATIPTYRPLYKVLRGSLSSTSGRSGRGYRLDNIEGQGRKDLPPPAVKRRPRNDTTLMATAVSDDEHNDYYSDRVVLESSKGDEVQTLDVAAYA